MDNMFSRLTKMNRDEMVARKQNRGPLQNGPLFCCCSIVAISDFSSLGIPAWLCGSVPESGRWRAGGRWPHWHTGSRR